MSRTDGGWVLPSEINPARKCVQLWVPDDPDHLAAFWGALWELTYWSNWQRDDGKNGAKIAETWKDVWFHARQLNDPGSPCSSEASCIAYLPSNAFTSYYPNSPFTSPNTVPPGYVVPPWYTNPGVPLPGVQPDDAMVNALAITGVLPTGLTYSQLPRARLDLTGPAEIEIELVNIPQGGLAMITVDDDMFNAQWFDLNTTDGAAIASLGVWIDAILGGGFVQTQIAEVQISAGAHYIDVTFWPNVGAGVVVGMGGGIREIRVCGDVQQAEPMQIPEFRLNGCNLEYRIAGDANWNVLGNVCGPQGAPGAPGAPGADGLPGANGWSVDMRWIEPDGPLQYKRSLVPAPEDWTDLFDFSQLKGDDGASVELRWNGGNLEWRQDDFDPDWTVLVEGNVIRGPQGIQGPMGPQGPEGQPGYTNIVPDTTPDNMCYAANHLAEVVTKLVTDIIADLQTLNLVEVFEQLIQTFQGWRLDDLRELIAWLELNAGDWTTIQADLTAKKADMICTLYESDLSQSAIRTWALNFTGWSTATGQVISQALDAISEGRWAQEMFIGGFKPGGLDCADCGGTDPGTCTHDPLGGTWTHHFDFRVSDGGFVNDYTTYSAVWETGGGWVPDPNETSRIWIERFLSSPATITAITVRIDNPYTGPEGRVILSVNNVNRDNTLWLPPDASGCYVWDKGPQQDVNSIICWIDTGFNGTIPINSVITDIWVSGTGANPFA